MSADRRFTGRLSFTLLALVLSACGSAQPALAPPNSRAAEENATPPQAPDGETPKVTTTDNAEQRAQAPSNPPANADATNEFKIVDTHTAKDTHGVEASKLEPTQTEALLKLVVLDKDKGPIAGIVISLVGADGSKYYTKETDAVGYAEALVPVGQDYEIVYLSLGNSEIAAKATVKDQPRLTMKLTLTFKRFVPRPSTTSARQHFILEGVEFDTGKATLRPGSLARLDSIVEYLTHKPAARIEISGHTDDVGSQQDNKALSERRARACRDYLIKQGIDGSRIQAVGYGAERPIAANDTPAGRQRNRRIEATEL